MKKIPEYPLNNCVYMCVHNRKEKKTHIVETQPNFNCRTLASLQQPLVTSSAKDRSILMRSEGWNEI